MKPLLFELKKSFNKRFIVIVTLLVATVLILFVSNLSLQSFATNEELKDIENWLRTAHGNSQTHNYNLKRNPNEQDEILQTLNQSIINYLRDLKSIHATDNWETALSIENEFLTSVEQYKGAGGTFPLTDRRIAHTLAMNDKLLAENIMPESDKYSIALPNFMKQVVDLFAHGGAIIILLLLIGDIYTSEFEQHSIKLLFTKPISKTLILYNKLITSVLIFFMISGVVFIATTVLGIFLGKKGTFSYPVLIEKNNAIEFMTISSYISQTFLLLTITMFLVISIHFIYSLLFKNTMITIVTLLGTLFIGYGINTSIHGMYITIFNPFLYILPKESVLFQNDYSWYVGIPAVMIMTLIIHLLTIWRNKTIYFN